MTSDSFLSEQIDRLEIYRALVACSRALDEEWWELLDFAFAKNAYFNDADGLGKLTIPQLRAALEQMYSTRVHGTHNIANVRYDIRGDRARVITEVATVFLSSTNVPTQFSLGRSAGYYIDDFVRADVGWRILVRTPFLRSKTRELVELSEDTLTQIAVTRHDLSEHSHL